MGAAVFVGSTSALMLFTYDVAREADPVRGDVTSQMVNEQCTSRTALDNGDDRAAACDAVIDAAYRVMDPRGTGHWEIRWNARTDTWSWRRR